MTQALEMPLYAPRARRQMLSPDVSTLTRIYDDDVNLVVWQRTLNKAVERYTQWLMTQPQGFGWQEVIRGRDSAELTTRKLPHHPDRQDFIDDFTEILDMFCCLFELEAVGMRLRVITRAMCPRFHTDHVPCRLITTYGGTGTEWLPGRGDGQTDVDVSSSDSASVLTQRVRSGDVALLKGDAWHGNEHFGLVHRSPQLAAHQKRLLLTLDFG